MDFSKERRSPSPAPAAASVARSRWPARPRAPRSSSTTTASRWTARSRPARVANDVVDEIKKAGGEAVANANSVAEMAGGASIVQSAIDNFGRIDGVVCVAGILRERMLFNMTEDDWDPVVATHLKGHFTGFRCRVRGHAQAEERHADRLHVGRLRRLRRAGELLGGQGRHRVARRSAAVGLHKYGVTANCIAPVARTRMSANVPMEIAGMGDAEDVAPMVVYLLSDQARHVTGQVYTVSGSKIAVWNQPAELRAMFKDGGGAQRRSPRSSTARSVSRRCR